MDGASAVYIYHQRAVLDVRNGHFLAVAGGENVRFGLILRECLEAASVIGLHITPVIIGLDIALYGQGGFFLVKEHLHYHIVAARLFIEYPLYVASHGENFVVLPRLGEVIERKVVGSGMVEFHKASQRQQARFVTETQSGLRFALGNGIGGCGEELLEQWSLMERSAIVGGAAICAVGIPPSVDAAPEVHHIVAVEEVVELHIGVVALLIACHVPEVNHQLLAIDAVGGKLAVGEEFFA